MTDAASTDDIAQAAREAGLLEGNEKFVLEPLAGGVSSDVFCFLGEGRAPVVVKRALPKLRVAQDWRAPVARVASEVRWLRLVESIDSRLVPQVLAEDAQRHLFFMSYLPVEQFPVWKQELLHGRVDPAFATSVGRSLAHIHAETAHSGAIASAFANDAQFLALRLDPFLLHAARAHSDVAARLEALADGVRTARIALMHGDVSPKNILGRTSPVFLDAETACYGDPAFDLAFCLNHLLLKCMAVPAHRAGYAQAFRALRGAYVGEAVWESQKGLDARAADLIGGLMLARIDGKSPVEYITSDRDRDFVRREAKELLNTGAKTLEDVLDLWLAATERYFTGSAIR